MTLRPGTRETRCVNGDTGAAEERMNVLFVESGESIGSGLRSFIRTQFKATGEALDDLCLVTAVKWSDPRS